MPQASTHVLETMRREKISKALKGRMPKNIKQIAGWNKGNPSLWLIGNKHCIGRKPHNKGITGVVQMPWRGKERPELKGKLLGIKRPQFAGERSPVWIKDRTQLKKSGSAEKDRRSSAYNTWRKEVYERDHYCCRIKSEQCSGRIEAHHILDWSNYPELRYQTNNGITLCHAHHPRKRAEEKRLAPAFQELVSVSKQIF